MRYSLVRGAYPLGERCGSWSGLPGVAGDGVGVVHHPGSFSPAVQQKIHHTLRIKATGINQEPNARQAIEAPLDDLLKLVDRPTVGGCLDPAGELCGLGVICVAVAVGQIRGFLGQPVNPALPHERDKRAEHDEVDRPAAQDLG